MKRARYLIVAACIGATLQPAARADTMVADTICPEATQYVSAFRRLSPDSLLQTIYDTAQAAADSYARCSAEKRANGLREAQFYADARGAQLGVVAARGSIALNRIEDARRELQHYRPLAQQIVDWPKSAGTSEASDSRPSMYRAAAREIVAAIDAELARLPSPAPAVPK